jgi:Raf kinase inhibitor-like YbhB/YbcL family protein
MRPGMRAAYISPVTRWAGGLIACGVAILAGCGGGGSSESAPSGHIAVRSPAFADGRTMPTAYTCSGKNVSPPLSWSHLPSGTARLQLRMNDLTAHFLHWSVTGIDPGTHAVAAGRTPDGGKAAKNDFGKVGYGGPCPPEGDDPHRYAFTVVALDRAAKVLDRGSLVGTFSRD